MNKAQTEKLETILDKVNNLIKDLSKTGVVKNSVQIDHIGKARIELINCFPFEDQGMELMKIRTGN